MPDQPTNVGIERRLSAVEAELIIHRELLVDTKVLNERQTQMANTLGRLFGRLDGENGMVAKLDRVIENQAEQRGKNTRGPVIFAAIALLLSGAGILVTALSVAGAT